jgi:hypothetical protein
VARSSAYCFEGELVESIFGGRDRREPADGGGMLSVEVQLDRETRARTPGLPVRGRSPICGQFRGVVFPNEAVCASSGRSAAALSAQDGANLIFRFEAVQPSRGFHLRWSNGWRSVESDLVEQLL